MSDSSTYDLAIIGSGTAAQVASFRVRAAGWSVAVWIICRSAEPVPCAAAIRRRC
jgi:succinate dehydrogenase/fumarate reductase flavoprotein subunit